MTDKQIKKTTEELKATIATSEQLMRDDVIANAILNHDVCLLKTPIHQGNKVLNCAKLKRKAVVSDRIQAVRWSLDMFDAELPDAVRSYVASLILEFGEARVMVKTEKDKYHESVSVDSVVLVDEPQALPVDTIIEQMGVGDFVNVAYLMGKS